MIKKAISISIIYLLLSSTSLQGSSENHFTKSIGIISLVGLIDYVILKNTSKPFHNPTVNSMIHAITSSLTAISSLTFCASSLTGKITGLYFMCASMGGHCIAWQKRLHLKR